MINHQAEIRHNLNLNLEEQFQQLDKLQSLPLLATVATGKKCNLQCAFCIDRSFEDKKNTDLTLEQFQSIAAPINRALRVQIYGWGDPLVNPNYESIFDHVVKNHPGTRIHISTNGTLLTDKWINKLIGYGKCLINISLNAATAETYLQVTQRDLFHRIVNNLRSLIQAKSQKGNDDFIVTLSFVTIKPNIHELPDFIKFCAKIGVQYAKIQDLNIFEQVHHEIALNENDGEIHDIFMRTFDIASKEGVNLDTFIYRPVKYFDHNSNAQLQYNLPKDLQPIWKQGDKILFFPQRGECYAPWQNFMVMQSGAVYTCCRGKEIMGNLLEQSFDEIWNGEKYRAYRRSINSFRPPNACRSCPVKMGFANY